MSARLTTGGDGNRCWMRAGVVRDWLQRDSVMLKRLSTAGVAALLAGLIFAASAIAATATYQERVFRYRAVPGENVDLRFAAWYDETSSRPRYLWAYTNSAPSVGSNCSVWPYGSAFEVYCALTSSETERDIRYRVSLSDGDDYVAVMDEFTGVVYGGAGGDNLGEYGRIFGGSGNDRLGGLIVYGGPGDDAVSPGTAIRSRRPVLRGGRGEDSMEGPGRLYGGHGDDRLRDNLNGADTFFGGPGRDIVVFPSRDEHGDVARLRGGGADTVRCDARLDRSDTLLVDGSDRVLPRCAGARILLSGQRGDVRSLE